jgi:hypothetical protein
MRHLRPLTSAAALLALPLFAGCGDDGGEAPAPVEKTGTLVVRVAPPEGPITGACVSVVVRDGAGTAVLEKARECAPVGDDLVWETPCAAMPGRLTHAVELRVVAAWASGGTDYAPRAEAAGDLAALTNPCPNGCLLQASCAADAERCVTFDIGFEKKEAPGEVEVTVSPTLAEPMAEADVPTTLCWNLAVTNAGGEAVGDVVRACSGAGEGAEALVVAAEAVCDAAIGEAANGVSASLAAVFVGGAPDDGGAGVALDYDATCDGGECAGAFTCDAATPAAAVFTPTLRRIYPVGLAHIHVATTASGTGSEAVAGGCYALVVTNSQDQELVRRTAVCTAFHAAETEGPADIRVSVPCDTTPWDEGGNAHAVSLVLESLHDADNAPEMNGLPPTMSLEGYLNPCPAETPCQAVLACDAEAEAEVDFELELLFGQ